MFALKFVILLVSCLIFVASSPAAELVFYEPQDALHSGNIAVLQSRHTRSPQRRGNVDVGFRKGQYGREASVQYNHNLYTSRNGRGSIDAYGHASRNFDYNRNNFGAGIQGRWRF